MSNLENLKIKLFADAADLKAIEEMGANPLIKGFTTNPTLMRKAGVTNYKEFAVEALKLAGDRPISFEVFADDFDEMEKQAIAIAAWGKNVYVKIPVTNTKGEFSGDLVERLSYRGVQLNVTALMTLEQVRAVIAKLSPDTPAVVSVFVGRIADVGLDPRPIMREASEIMKARPKAELLWASQREPFNIFEAEEAGCHIITVTPDCVKKLPLVGKDLTEFSLETVQMFYNDAQAAGYSIDTDVTE